MVPLKQLVIYPKVEIIQTLNRLLEEQGRTSAKHLEGPGRIAKNWTDSQLEKMLPDINAGAVPG